MVISHTYRYVYVELPHTGTTAISAELRQHYGGTTILRKHAHYDEFCRIATPAEKQYLVFSGIRNPLDEAVSVYYKYLTDHRQRYSRFEQQRARLPGSLTRADRARYRAIQEQALSFPAYLQRFYRWPYSNWSQLSHKRFDYIIRYEQLQEGFAEVIRRLRLEPKRPLPVVNRTVAKRDSFLTYYSPDCREHAKRIFGPFMHEWGYAFPAEWDPRPISAATWLQYRALGLLRSVYWRHLRWHPVYGTLLKGLR